MDHKELKKELLKAARGQKSQLQVSRRLGYTYNQVYRWESGSTRIHWREFAQFCQSCKVDLKKILKDSISYPGNPEQSDFLVKHLIGSQKMAAVAKVLGVSRFVLSDWSKGKSDPPLEGVLKLLESRDLINLFLENFPGLNSNLNFGRDLKSKKAARNFFYENPLAGAAWISFDLMEYQKAPAHISGFFTRHLGISASEEKRLLEQMEALGLIQWKQGKYVKTSLNFSLRGNAEQERATREFWMDRGLKVERMQGSELNKNHFGFMIFPADEKKRKLIFEAYREFINVVQNVCNTEPQGKDELMAMTLQIFGIKE